MTMTEQLKIVESQVEDALAKGAKVLLGGKRDGAGKGMYYPPTVLTDVTMDMKLMTEETFGPLLPIIPYDDVEEAIKIANSTPTGCRHRCSQRIWKRQGQSRESSRLAR
jgi:acyl-CoA reductase-like NAD-dependent aldehyde dehydrogenase